MKVLIDENLPRKLAGHLKGHECRTVAECAWAGKKNGELLSLAEPQFDVLLTLDKNLPYQQDLKLAFWRVITNASSLFIRTSRARTAPACIGCKGCTERSKMFVSIRMGISQRSGYMLARLMASSESGGVSRWLFAHWTNARAISSPLVPVATAKPTSFSTSS